MVKITSEVEYEIKMTVEQYIDRAIDKYIDEGESYMTFSCNDDGEDLMIHFHNRNTRSQYDNSVTIEVDLSSTAQDTTERVINALNQSLTEIHYITLRGSM